MSAQQVTDGPAIALVNGALKLPPECRLNRSSMLTGSFVAATRALLLTFASGVTRVAAINVGAAAMASVSTAAKRVKRILSSSVDHHGWTTPASACGECMRHDAARRYVAGTSARQCAKRSTAC